MNEWLRRALQCLLVVCMATLGYLLINGDQGNLTWKVQEQIIERLYGFGEIESKAEETSEVFKLPLRSGEDMPIPKREWSLEEFDKFLFGEKQSFEEQLEELFPINPNPGPKVRIEPLLRNGLQPGEIKNGLLGGEWCYEYDALFFNRYTWISSVEVGGVLLNIEVYFDDWDAGSSPHNLAFRLSPEDYTPFRLHIKKDGQFDPNLSHFKELYADRFYKGGYNAFEKDLRELGIDWITLFEMLDEEFQLQYLQLDPEKYWPPGPKFPQPEIGEVHA